MRRESRASLDRLLRRRRFADDGDVRLTLQAAADSGPQDRVVVHDYDANHVDIENNIMWHTDSRAQTILIEEGQTNNVTIKNNLDVEDPANFTNSNIYTMAWDVNKSHGETIENNTAKVTNIKPGVSDNGMTAVQGIEPGTMVATSSFEKLQDGAKTVVSKTPIPTSASESNTP